MSIPAGIARVIYYGSGTTGPFAFNYKLYATAHLKVVKTSLLGVDSTLVINTDYTIAIAADFSSATITLVATLNGTGLAASSEQLTLTRDPPIEQLTEWPRNDPFPSQTHERAADLAVMMIDRLAEKVGRSLLLPESSVITDLALPTPDPLLFLRWNAAGDALENMAVTTPGALLVSPFMQTVLDDTTAAAARTTLGAAASTDLIPIARGGTGQTTVAAARTAFGIDTDDTVTFGAVVADSALGNDGGRVSLRYAPNGSTLSGAHIVVQGYLNNRLAIFENGGDFQGYFLDVGLASAGIGSEIFSGAHVATQAEMVTGTSLVVPVTPGRAMHHPTHAKAFSRANLATGTPVLNTSFGVSSLTDNGVGLYTTTFSTAFAAATGTNAYGPNGFARDVGGSDLFVCGVSGGALTTTTIALRNVNSATAAADGDISSLTYYGPQ